MGCPDRGRRAAVADVLGQGGIRRQPRHLHRPADGREGRAVPVSRPHLFRLLPLDPVRPDHRRPDHRHLAQPLHWAPGKPPPPPLPPPPPAPCSTSPPPAGSPPPRAAVALGPGQPRTARISPTTW